MEEENVRRRLGIASPGSSDVMHRHGWRGRGSGRPHAESLESRLLMTASYTATELTAIEQFSQGQLANITGIDAAGDLVGWGSPGGFVYHDGEVIPLSGPPASDQ